MDRYSADSHCPDCFQPATANADSSSNCEHCGFDARQAVDGAQYLAPFSPLHGGRYLIGRILGHPGSYGVVYAGWHQQLRREVAIKEFFPATAIAERCRDQRTVRARPGQQALFDRWRQRFLNEARLLAGFEHAPRIVQVSDVFEENGSAYLVMERLRGESLNQTLQLQASERGLQARHTLQVDEAELLFIALLEALNTLHQRQVLHRDISPGNLYLQGGQPAGLTLLDFGLARAADAGPVQTGSVGLGTPGFVAPEQMQRDGQPLGPWSDLYSAAAVLYLSLCGSPPPPANERASGLPLTPIRRLRPDLPQPLAEQIDHCLRLDRHRRPQSAAQVCEQLAAATLIPPPAATASDRATRPPADTAADTPTPSPSPRPGRPSRPVPASRATSEPVLTPALAPELAAASSTPALHTDSAMVASIPAHAGMGNAVSAIVAQREDCRQAPKASPPHDAAQRPARTVELAPGQRGGRKRRSLLLLLLLTGLGGALWPSLKQRLDQPSLPPPPTADTDPQPPATDSPSRAATPITVLPASPLPAEVILPTTPGRPASSTMPPVDRQAANHRPTAPTLAPRRSASSHADSPHPLPPSDRSTRLPRYANPVPARLPTPAATDAPDTTTRAGTTAVATTSTPEPAAIPSDRLPRHPLPGPSGEPTATTHSASRSQPTASSPAAQPDPRPSPGDVSAASRPANIRPGTAPPAWTPRHPVSRPHSNPPARPTPGPVLGRLPRPIPESARGRTTPLPHLAHSTADSPGLSPLQRHQRQLSLLPREQRLQQVLAQLDFDLRNRCYITPADNNLLLDFTLLRQLDPQHHSLHKAFWTLISFFTDSTRKALDLHDPVRAANWLQRGRELAPDMQRWQPLSEELQRIKGLTPLPGAPVSRTSWSDPDHWRESAAFHDDEPAAADAACFGGEACGHLTEELYDDRY